MNEASENKMDLAIENDEQVAAPQEEEVIEEAVEAVDLPSEEAVQDAEEAAEAIEAAEAVEEAAAEVEETAEAVEDAEAVEETEAAETAEAAVEQEEPSPVKKSDGVGHLVIVGILSLILAVLLCMPYFLKGTGNSNYDLSEGVAVTVNGVAIGEKEITDYVAGLRGSMDLNDDAAWADWMDSNGYTPETLRSAVIQYYVSRELQIQAAAENNVSISDEAVEEQVNKLIEQFGSQEALEEALAEQGADLEMYRDSIRLGLQQQELAKKVAQDVEPVTDEQILTILKAYYPEQVSEDATTLEGLDEELVSYVREALESNAVEQAYSAWMQNFEEQAAVEITDIPEGLPYDVAKVADDKDASDKDKS